MGCLFPQAGREVSFLGDLRQGQCWAGLMSKDKEGAWVGRAHLDHRVVPQGTQQDLKAEDKLGGGQGRLQSRAAGGLGRSSSVCLGEPCGGRSLLRVLGGEEQVP